MILIPKLPIINIDDTTVENTVKDGLSIEVIDSSDANRYITTDIKEREILPWSGMRILFAKEMYGNTNMIEYLKEKNVINQSGSLTSSLDSLSSTEGAPTKNGQSEGRGAKIEYYIEKGQLDNLFEEKTSPSLFLLDAIYWKSQDHYEVLGLGKMRWLASEDNIKLAYRKKALLHHPDKNNSSSSNNDKYFKCLQRAYEFMSNPTKRRQWDSIDPLLDDSVPTKIPRGSDFYSTYTPVFRRNSHFSKKQPVPDLGNEKSSRTHVEFFYKFWSTFESWRSYELLDEEPVDEVDNREERRWLEKQNRAQRTKKKNEENARILKLVDIAIKLDPRLAKYKEQDNLAKHAKKLEKEKRLREEQIRAKAEAEEAKKREELLEIESKKRAEQAKREREEKKKLVKSERRALRAIVQKFEQSPEDAALCNVRLESLIKTLKDDIPRLKTARETLEKSTDILSAVKELLEESGRMSKDHSDSKKNLNVKTSESKNAEDTKYEKVSGTTEWTDAELKLLTKAANLFPGGTPNRWETVADYFETHSSKDSRRSVNEIIQKFKNMNIREKSSTNASAGVVKERPWSPEEQKKLESALKQYPSSGKNAYKGSDRWDKIAELLEGRTKKEVMARVKEILLRMKSKNAK